MEKDDVSKEWAKLFLTQLERHENTLSEFNKDCQKCREDILERMTEIRVRQRELSVKILIGAVIVGLAADAAIRFFLK